MNDLNETAQSIGRFEEMASEAAKILPKRSARNRSSNRTFDLNQNSYYNMNISYVDQNIMNRSYH